MKTTKTLTSLLFAVTMLNPTQTFGQEQETKKGEIKQTKQIQYNAQLANQFNYVLTKSQELTQIKNSMPKGTNFENENFYCIQLNQLQGSLNSFYNLFSSGIKQIPQTEQTMIQYQNIQNLNERINLAYKDNDKPASNK